MKKFKISKEQLDKIIKEEALRLKERNIIKESAQKRLTMLESKVLRLEQEMRDVYAGEELDEELEEIFGIGGNKYDKMSPEQVKAAFDKMVQKQDFGRAAAMNAARTAKEVQAKHGDEAAVKYMIFRLKNPGSMYGVYDPATGEVKNTAIQKASGFAGDMLGGPTSGGFRVDDNS